MPGTTELRSIYSGTVRRAFERLERQVQQLESALVAATARVDTLEADLTAARNRIDVLEGG